MINLEILNEIDLVKDQSEIDVIVSIVESYQKMLNIIEASNYDETIIQEMCIFTEAADGSDKKKTIVESVKDIFKKLFQAISLGFKKIANKVKKVFATKKEQFITVTNCLRILDVLQNTNVRSVVKEGYTEIEIEFEGIYQEFNNMEVYDDIIQEGITDNIRMYRADKRIEKAIKQQDKPIVDELVKYYNSEIRHHVMSKHDIVCLVRALVMTNPPEKMNDVKKALQQLNNSSQMKSFSAETIHNYELATTLGDELIARKAEEIENKMKEKMGSNEAMMRLDLIGKFAETLGGAIDRLGGTNNFSKINTANMIYNTNVAEKASTVVKSGVELVGNTFVALADRANKTIHKLPQTGRTLEQIGADLYHCHIDFDDAVFDDEEKRKQLGMKSDKLAESFLFCADGLKEETYGYKDDWFNKDVFNLFNQGFKGFVIGIPKWIAGGPITLCLTILSYLITGTIGFVSTYAATGDTKSAAIGGATAMGTKFIKDYSVKALISDALRVTAQSHFAKKLTPDTDRVSKRKLAEANSRNENITERPPIIPTSEPILAT